MKSHGIRNSIHFEALSIHYHSLLRKAKTRGTLKLLVTSVCTSLCVCRFTAILVYITVLLYIQSGDHRIWKLIMVRHFGHLERNSSLNQIKYVLGSIVKYIVAFSYCFLLSLAFFPWTVTSLTRKFQTQVRYNYYYYMPWTHSLFSDWPKAYSEFSKSAPGISSSCRLYNNRVKDTQGHG